MPPRPRFGLRSSVIPPRSSRTFPRSVWRRCGPPATRSATSVRFEVRAGSSLRTVLVPRTEADAPGLTLGVVSTPAGGAYEWQWYATGVDRVPATILAAAARTTIAIVDTGADLSAPALAGKVRASYDVRTGGRAVGDASGHGTFVASIAGGSTADGGAVAGFGGAARLLIVKVGDGTSVSDVDVAAGIVRSVQSGARIVNVSLAGRTRSAVEASAVAYAARHGVLVVAAAGNDALAGNPLEYPAALLRPVGSNGAGGLGLAVGASGMDGRRAPFSEHGSFLSLAAPGTTVFGAVASTARASLFARVQLPGRRGALRARERHLVFRPPGVRGGRARLGGRSGAHGPAGCGGARADRERPRRLVSGARIRRARRLGCGRSGSAPRLVAREVWDPSRRGTSCPSSATDH